jgi:hypothetical protein
MPLPDPVDAAPTIRRLSELVSRGFTVGQVARAAGRPPDVIAVLYFLHWVSPATDTAIERAHEVLTAQQRSA